MNGYSIHHTRRDLDMEAIAAFDDREEAREAARLARAAAAGHTHSVCPRCGDVRTLGWAGGECNNVDESTDSGVCEGVYRAAGRCGVSPDTTRPLTGSLASTEVVRGISLRRVGGDPDGGLALIAHGGAGEPNSTYITREEALILADALRRAALGVPESEMERWRL